MSLKIVKAGIADSVQDMGRFGFQHLGINPTGAMDLNAMQVANALVGNALNCAVIELSFPASVILFQQSACIALSGADFSATVEGKIIPINKSFLLPAGTELKFSKGKFGSRCYLAVRGGFDLPKWLASSSTHIKAGVGGRTGRALKRHDELNFNGGKLNANNIVIMPWSVNVSEFYEGDQLRCIPGNEFDWLQKNSQQLFTKEKFSVTLQSDRMGYHLKGSALKLTKKRELLSTAVTFGTVQLLPNGSLIILMADHQTTGGYPRIAHMISADRSRIAQCGPHDKISFQFVGLEEAEQLALSQKQSLLQMRTACALRFDQYLKDRI